MSDLADHSSVELPGTSGLLNLVVAGLNRRKGQWREIEKISGVPYDTLSKIARGATENPGVLTVQALQTALFALDAKDLLAA